MKEIKPWYLEIYIDSEGCLLYWGSQLSSSKEWELRTTCVASREISFSHVKDSDFIQVQWEAIDELVGREVRGDDLCLKQLI